MSSSKDALAAEPSVETVGAHASVALADSDAGLTVVELAALRRTLLGKGRDLAEELSLLLAGLTPGATDILDARPGETRIEKTRRYLTLIDKKVKEIGAGVYGRCGTCATPIPYRMLAELPWMETCRTCTLAAASPS